MHVPSVIGVTYNASKTLATLGAEFCIWRRACGLNIIITLACEPEAVVENFAFQQQGDASPLD